VQRVKKDVVPFGELGGGNRLQHRLPAHFPCGDLFQARSQQPGNIGPGFFIEGDQLFTGRLALPALRQRADELAMPLFLLGQPLQKRRERRVRGKAASGGRV
jgi:hypothetical protein